jgi:hypothetical protein
MEHIKAIRESRQRKLVDDRKFERHFKRAIRQDVNSRKIIFDDQTEFGIIRRQRYKQLTTNN